MRRWIVLIVAGLVLATTAVPASLTRASVATPRASPCPAGCERFEMAWVGDILLGDAAQPLLDAHGYQWPFAHLRPLLAADFVIGNAEGPITTRSEPYFVGEKWSYNAQPAAATALAAIGFNAVGLSNNHSYDRGPEGLADTLQHLRRNGIQPFGAGLDGDAAAAPLLVPTPYGSVAVLGFSSEWRFGAVAGPDQPGTVPFSEAAIARGKALAAAAGARWTVAYVHWGENYAPVIDEQRRVAASFAAAGYDLVVGHHAHVPQEVDLVSGMPVLYSLGNFVFGSKGRFSKEFPGYGLVARTFLGPQGFGRIELTCIVTDNDLVAFQPRPCDHDQTGLVMQGLGPLVVWKDDRGIIVW